MSETVLFIEDDQELTEMLEAALRREGYRCLDAQTGHEGLAKERTQAPNLIVLDLMLPDIDGWDVCRQIRTRSTVPIMIMTGRDDLVDRVVGLEIGADGFIVKPFGAKEFVARVRAHLRRATEYARPRELRSLLDFGEVQIDEDRHEVRVRGETRHFTRKEFDLLKTLAENEGRVLRSSDLLKHIWGYDDNIRSRTLDVHIGRVRQKVEREPSVPRIIVTVPCIGYKFISPQRAA